MIKDKHQDMMILTIIIFRAPKQYTTNNIGGIKSDQRKCTRFKYDFQRLEE